MDTQLARRGGASTGKVNAAAASVASQPRHPCPAAAAPTVLRGREAGAREYPAGRGCKGGTADGLEKRHAGAVKHLKGVPGTDNRGLPEGGFRCLNV